LHIWQQDLRHMHLGSSFLWLSLKDYFGKFKLKQLVCEPHAHNEPPNKLLRKIGARKIKTYETIPHPICLKQMVSRYEIDKDSFKELTTTFE
jgi:RimJ/RimL family protein N-acetyltransferase